MYFELSLTDAWKSTRNWITRIESRTSFVDFLLSGGLTFVSSPVFTTEVYYIVPRVTLGRFEEFADFGNSGNNRIHYGAFNIP